MSGVPTEDLRADRRRILHFGIDMSAVIDGSLLTSIDVEASCKTHADAVRGFARRRYV
jgi:hypothetical protein